MKQLHARWGQQARFLDVFVRQAHPGPEHPGYQSFAEKLREAEAYRRQEDIPWPVAVDDLEGSVHQAYSGLADPAYLLDADGRVAMFLLVGHAPRLDEAFERLLARGGRGVVSPGTDRVPHVLAGWVDGWRALERGAPQSLLDLAITLPGSPAVFWIGRALRPVLAPVALRARRLPRAARALLGLAAIGLGVAVSLRVLGRRPRL